MGNPWEQRKLKDLGRAFIGGGTPTTSNELFWNGDLPWFQSSDLDGEENFHLLPNKRISTYAVKNSSAKEIPGGSIAIVTRVGVGKVAYIPFTYATSQDFLSLTGLDVDPIFGVFMITKAIRDNVAQQGSAIKGVSGKELKELSVEIPSKLEQKKIGMVLINTENLITLHQRKLELLKKKKAGLLQKMFPKPGSNVPELRFPGFTEPWEQRKLGEVTERVQGNDGRMDLPILTISAATGWLAQEERFSTMIAGKELKNYTLLKEGELSYNHGNSKLAKYGTVFALKDYKEALVPRVYHSFRMKQGDPGFIEYLFKTGLPDLELRKLISSGARMDGLLNISYHDFENIELFLPSGLEQWTISSFFQRLDNLITLHQRKLDILKEQKKGLLQKMFPKEGENEPELRFPEFR